VLWGCGRQCPAVVAGWVERNLEVIELAPATPTARSFLSACQLAPQLRALIASELLLPALAAARSGREHQPVGMAAERLPAWLQRSGALRPETLVYD